MYPIIYLSGIHFSLYKLSLALQTEGNEDSKRFFRIISPLFGNTLEDDILESLFVHDIHDESHVNVKQPPLEEVNTSGADPGALISGVASVAEVTEAILKAKREKNIIRVTGSAHSVHASVFPKDGITLRLTGDLRKVEIQEVQLEGEENWLYCRIGAGCYLGRNPMDPDSDLQNSACYQVAVQGFGFPELAGITHQTVGGFIMTGSAGGSLWHSFHEVIQEIEFVDGNGHLQIAKPGTDLWSAVGASMGLFGVITHVTFRLPEMRLVKGSESNKKFADSALGPNDKGETKLKESLENNEYFRVNWFPQKDVRRVQEWVGKQTSKGDIVPYKSILSCTLTAGMAAVALKVCNCLLQKEHPSEWDYAIIGTILRQFVPLGEPKRFCDIWFESLPMDNQAHTDSIIKVDFTEIWIPLGQCKTVMDKLLKLFENQKAAGNFAIEIYGAKESPFWLSMSYNQKMVRIDAYWWVYNKGDKREFFSYFWDALLDIPGTRLHWGKYLPLPGQKCGNTKFNLSYLKSVYPKLDNWLKLRDEMDPDQVFVTEYWRSILEISSAKSC